MAETPDPNLVVPRLECLRCVGWEGEAVEKWVSFLLFVVAPFYPFCLFTLPLSPPPSLLHRSISFFGNLTPDLRPLGMQRDGDRQETPQGPARHRRLTLRGPAAAVHPGRRPPKSKATAAARSPLELRNSCVLSESRCLALQMGSPTFPLTPTSSSTGGASPCSSRP